MMPAVRVSLIAEFRVLMEVAPPGDDARRHVERALLDFNRQRRRRLRGERRNADGLPGIKDDDNKRIRAAAKVYQQCFRKRDITPIIMTNSP